MLKKNNKKYKEIGVICKKLKTEISQIVPMNIFNEKSLNNCCRF